MLEKEKITLKNHKEKLGNVSTGDNRKSSVDSGLKTHAAVQSVRGIVLNDGFRNLQITSRYSFFPQTFALITRLAGEESDAQVR